MKYALIDSNGQVVNTVEWDGAEVVDFGGLTAIQSDIAAIGWTYANSTFTAPQVAATTPTVAELAQDALNTIQLTSTSAPSLNGTYHVTPQAISNLNATTTYILLNGTFPKQLTSMPWSDTSATIHYFTIVQFKAFASAIADYVAEVQFYVSSGGQMPLPSNQLTIA